MDNNVLGERVRKARGGASLRSFAKKCGISHTHLDNIEKGIDHSTGKRVSATLDILNKLSAATGLPISYLTGEVDTPEYLLNAENESPSQQSPDTKKEYQMAPSDIQEFYDLLVAVGVREPNKPLSRKAKTRLFNLVKNNKNLIVESDDESE